MVEARKDDNLSTIIEKIMSGKSLDDKKAIYLMFTITHPHYTQAVNNTLLLFYPDFHKVIRKALFPTTLDKIEKFFGIR
jgi:hypothetical protein